MCLVCLAWLNFLGVKPKFTFKIFQKLSSASSSFFFFATTYRETQAQTKHRLQQHLAPSLWSFGFERTLRRGRTLFFCFFYQSVQNVDICEIIKILMGCKTLLDPRLENKILISLQRLLGAQCDQIKGYADVCLKKKKKKDPLCIPIIGSSVSSCLSYCKYMQSRCKCQ